MADRDVGADAQMAPAVARNRDVILAVLKRVLPTAGLVLEIASGTGEHAVYFATRLPTAVWQPSDPGAAALRSIDAYRRAADLPNLRAPIALDAAAPDWPVRAADAIVAINMIHIAPWSATTGLMAGAARTLATGAPLVLYGPYKEGGRHTAPSNAAFDADLRNRDPAWGVRDLEEVADTASAAGLRLVERIPMPANNLSLVFRRG